MERINNDEHINFIYTLGTQNNTQTDAGTHYVAAQIFKDRNGIIKVLHRDSLNETANDEFRSFVKKTFGNDTVTVKIINITDQPFKQHVGTNTCGLFALTAVRNGGILDTQREIIIEEQIQNFRSNWVDYMREREEQEKAFLGI